MSCVPSVISTQSDVRKTPRTWSAVGPHLGRFVRPVGTNLMYGVKEKETEMDAKPIAKPPNEVTITQGEIVSIKGVDMVVERISGQYFRVVPVGLGSKGMNVEKLPNLEANSQGPIRLVRFGLEAPKEEPEAAPVKEVDLAPDKSEEEPESVSDEPLPDIPLG